MQNLTKIRHESASSLKEAKHFMDRLAKLSKECFRDFDTSIYDVMSFFDTNKNERDFGNIGITGFAKHFRTTLDVSDFGKARGFQEWQSSLVVKGHP